MRLALTLVVLAGCYQPVVPTGVPCSQSGQCPEGQQCDVVRNVCGGDGADARTDDVARDTPTDSAAIDAASLGMWTTPVALVEINSGMLDTDPAISADGLELFFASNRLGNGNSDIWRTTRPTLGAAFAPATLVTELSTAADDAAPELSGDGLTIYLRRSGDIFRATRVSTSSAFGALVLDSELSSAEPDSNPAISDNGLFASVTHEPTVAQRELYLYARPSMTAPWGPARQLTELSTPGSESGAALTDDGLELWFHSDRGNPGGPTDLYLATRSSTSGQFVVAPVTELNTTQLESDPSLTADLRIIVFERAQNLVIATR